MNAKKMQSKKTVTLAVDPDTRRTLAEASQAVSEVATAAIDFCDDGRRPKRS